MFNVIHENLAGGATKYRQGELICIDSVTGALSSTFPFPFSLTRSLTLTFSFSYVFEVWEILCVFLTVFGCR